MVKVRSHASSGTESTPITRICRMVSWATVSNSRSPLSVSRM